MPNFPSFASSGFNMTDSNLDIDALTAGMNETQKEQFEKYLEYYQTAVDLDISEQSLIMQGDLLVFRMGEKIMQYFRGVLLVLCSDPDDFNEDLVDSSNKNLNII